ncbi:MAG: ABC-type branched-chain amino acid transport system, ATPase component, partial [Frankiales bacterium]|nr:ABC-type branched-chain amino acid transport system, ATPase component [Frankiales bacterium]
MADGPRLLVPTERQRTVGDEADYRDLEQLVEEEQVVAPRESRLRTFARDFDPRTVEGPKLVLLVLCLTSVCARIDEQAIGVLLPQIRADLGLNVTFLASIASAAGILLTLSALPLGYLADRVSRVWLVRSGTLLTGTTIGLTGLATSALGLAGARLGNGIAQGIAQPASFPLMADYFPPRGRARVFAVYFAAAQFGLILGPALAGVLGDRIGWRATLLLLGGIAVGVGLLTLLLREPVRGRYDRPDPDQPLPPPPSFGEAYRAAASVATLRRFWYATPFVGTRGLFGLLLLPLFMSEVYQLSTTQLGLLFALNGISGLVGLLVAGPLGSYLLRDRPGRFMTVLGFAPVVQAAVIVVVSFRPPLPVTVLVLQVSVICEVIGQPGGFTLISFVVPARVRGLGLQTTVPWQLINLIALPILVAAMEGFGMQRGILLIVPFLVIGGLILATGAPGVDRDMRAARAADAADDAARQVAADGTRALLVCRDVDVAYDGVQVLFGVDLDVAEGEVVALLGTNGAGKSTLLRAIAGTQEASNGAIFLNGRDITHLPPHENAASGVVMIPGGAAVFPSLSVAENLRAACWTLQDEPEAVATRTAEVLDLFPVLRERLDQPAGSLSGGEQQM